MLNYFNWADMDNLRIIIQSAIVLAILGFYIWLTVIDFKYREMELWKVLLVGGVNLILPIIPIFLFGCPCLRILSIIAIPAWIVLVAINTFINQENVIGQADVDIFNSQLIIDLIMIYWVFKQSQGTSIAAFFALSIMQIASEFLFFGLLSLAFVWLIKLIIMKIKNKNMKFKEIVGKYGKVPTIIAFLPLILVNLYMYMGT